MPSCLCLGQGKFILRFFAWSSTAWGKIKLGCMLPAVTTEMTNSMLAAVLSPSMAPRVLLDLLVAGRQHRIDLWSSAR